MKKRYSQILKFFLNRNYIGAVFLAVVLWVYTSLEIEYSPTTTIPLFIKLPPDRALRHQVSDSLEVVLIGKGWNLFNTLYLFSDNKCFIDLSYEKIEDSTYFINENKIFNSIYLSGNVRVKSISKVNIPLVTDRIIEKEVEISPNLTVLTKPGYKIKGEIEYSPNFVTIRGNKNLLSQIDTWETKPIVLHDIAEGQKGKLILIDSLKNSVMPTIKYVNYSFKVQQTAEETIYDVPINIRGFLPSGYKLYPDKIAVTIAGGIKDIENINLDSLVIFINASDLQNSSRKLFTPQIELPSNISLMLMKPAFIEVKKIYP